MEELSCPVCFNVYLSQSALGDRKPSISCANGHTVCADCFANLRQNDFPCPTCRDPLLPSPIVNRALLDVIDGLSKAMSRVPEIDVADMIVCPVPFASGAFADVYDAKWHNQDVAVKALRSIPELDKQIQQLQLEANLAIGLHHPNIIRLFGTTRMSGNRFGIVMEKIDNGSLDRYISGLDRQQAVTIALGVIDGLDYVHSKKIAHRDLKPQNILLAGPQLVPKITDFGVSKVIQTVVTNSAMVGTPKYAAPELLQPGSPYGCPADVFSLSVILFEMFSGQPAERGLGTNVMQIMLAVVQGQRPAIPAGFPNEIRPLVERGWAADAAQRSSLAEFRSALQKLSVVRAPSVGSPTSRAPDKQVRISMQQQSAEIAKVNLPLPVLSLKWNTSCERLNSQQLRMQMVADIAAKSNMARIVNESVLSVMKIIPRHLFIEEKRLPSFTGLQRPSDQDVVDAAYFFKKPIPATMKSNESSPEIIGTQLSMTEIIPGQSVLLVGIKGGYIQSLVAQLVGINGSVVTATSDTEAMDVCRQRVELYCPLRKVVQWVVVADVKNQTSVVEEIQRRKLLFHTVVYCGSVVGFPTELTAVLYATGNASIMAPVKNGNAQQFQLYQRRGKDAELRTITDFGVIFEEVH